MKSGFRLGAGFLAVAIILSSVVVSAKQPGNTENSANFVEQTEPVVSYATDEESTEEVAIEVDYNIDYNGKDPYATRVMYNYSLNLYDYKSMEMDVYLGVETGFRFWFIDVNGNRGFYDFKDLTPGEWHHLKIPAVAFCTGWGTNGDMSLVKGFMCEHNVSEIGVIKVKNLCFTKKEPQQHYLVKALDYTLDYSGTNPWATLKSESENYDLNDYEFLELDVYQSIGDAFRFYFSDTSGNRGFHDFAVIPGEWNHLCMPATVFNTGYGLNGDMTKVSGFMCEKGDGTLKVNNVKFTTATRPCEERDSFMWGVNKHSKYYNIYSDDNLEAQIHYMAEMGATILRIDAYINHLDSTDKTVRLCNAYGIKVMFVVGSVSGDEASYNYEEQYRWMNMIANRYNGKSGHGKLDYIQIDNECDIKQQFQTSSYGGGENMCEYDQYWMELISKRFSNYSKAIRDADSDVQIVINHGWTHHAFYDWLLYYGVDFDIIGMDWYADMANNFMKQGKRPVGQAEYLYNTYGKDIIICETNAWANTAAEETDVSNWDTLIDICEDAYKYPYIKGLIVYELCDEPYFETDKYNREAHFGLIWSQSDGTMLQPKPIYYRLKEMWGGEDLPVIPLDFITDNLDEIEYETNYFVEYDGDNPYDTRQEIGDTLNLNNYDNIEMNVYLDDCTGFRFWFVDKNGKRGFHDFSGLKKKEWNKISMPATGFDTSSENGDITAVNGFMCEHSSGVIKVNSLVFTSTFTTVHYPVKSLEYMIDYIGSNPYDMRKNEPYVYNLLDYDYIEFDAYLSGADVFRFWFIDTNGKRGFHDFSVTPGEWNHIVMRANDFNTGYGENGDKTKVKGFMCERNSEQLIVTNVQFTSDTPPTPVEIMLGDVNGDEVVDVRDYVTAQRYVETEAEFQDGFEAIDFDGDYSITEEDLDVLLRYLLGCISSLDDVYT